MKPLLLIVALLMTPAMAGATPVPSPLSGTTTEALPREAACCKVCRKGQACGDSCISRTKACTRPPGCACQGYSPALDVGPQADTRHPATDTVR